MAPPNHIAFVPTTLSASRLSSITHTPTLSHPTTPIVSHRLQPLPQRRAQISTTPPSPPAPAKSPSRILLWFHTDLRVNDNPALRAAATAASVPGGALVPVAAGGALDGEAGSLLAELKMRLVELGSGLVAAPGRVEKVLVDICRRLKLSAVYFNRSVLCSRVKVERRVVDALTRAGLHVEAFWGNMLKEPTEGMLTAKRGKEMGVKELTKILQKDGATALPVPERLPAMPAEAAKLRGQKAVEGKIGGGTVAGVRILEGMDKGRETLYLSKRADLVIALKVFLDFGAVSAKMVTEKVWGVMGRRGGRTFSEMIWREYLCVMAHRAVGVRSAQTCVSM